MEQIGLVSHESGKRIDAWLADKLGSYSRSYLQKLLDGGGVSVGGRKVKASYKIRAGDIVAVDIPDPVRLDVAPEKIKLDILYEDDDIVVVNKPKGMVVHPAHGNYSGTLVNALMEHCGGSLSDINGVIRPGIVHRIDKDTSGVIVAAKNNFAHERLSEKLKIHDIKRVYAALVHGVVRNERGTIDVPIGRNPGERKKMAVNVRDGRKAVTHFRVLERFKEATYIEVTLETGRTHQIRVHMSYIGHPVIGDTVYGRRKDRHDINGQALHARILGFAHPVSGEYMEFEAELPGYFKNLMEQLQKN